MNRPLIIAISTLLALSVAKASAQTSNEAQAIKPCLTNLGPEGQLVAGYPALIRSPVPFDTVLAEGGGISVFPEVRESLSVLADAKDSPGAGQPETTAAGEGVVTFLQGEDAVVHQCRVKVVAFDAMVHRASLEAGDCNLTRIAGLPELRPGHAQVWELPQAMTKIGAWPVTTMDIATLSERWFYLLGKSPGLGMLAWVNIADDGFHKLNLCAFDVAAERDLPEIADESLCRDRTGAPMRLAVGQTVGLLVQDAAGATIDDYDEASVALESVVDLVQPFDEGEDPPLAGPVLQAFAPGSTSVTVFFEGGDGQFQVQSCEVVVE